MIKTHLAKLGHKGRDKITGFEGVVSSVSFDLYGCVCCILTPPVVSKPGEEQKKGEGHWFDLSRVEVSGPRVMEPPDFDADFKAPEPVAAGRQGAAEKPVRE